MEQIGCFIAEISYITSDEPTVLKVYQYKVHNVRLQWLNNTYIERYFITAYNKFNTEMRKESKFYNVLRFDYKTQEKTNE